LLGVAAYLQVPKPCPIEGRLKPVRPHPGTELPRPGRTNRCVDPQFAFNPSLKNVHSPSGMGGRTDPPEISATTSTGLCLLGPAYFTKDPASNRGAPPHRAEALLTSRVTGSVSAAWGGAIIALAETQLCDDIPHPCTFQQWPCRYLRSGRRPRRRNPSCYLQWVGTGDSIPVLGCITYLRAIRHLLSGS
jgi:hypothetical protein